jgi:hypothetical protein
MYYGWECNPHTKKVVAKMTKLKRYIKIATMDVFFSPHVSNLNNNTYVEKLEARR